LWPIDAVFVLVRICSQIILSNWNQYHSIYFGVPGDLCEILIIILMVKLQCALDALIYLRDVVSGTAGRSPSVRWDL